MLWLIFLGVAAATDLILLIVLEEWSGMVMLKVLCRAVFAVSVDVTDSNGLVFCIILVASDVEPKELRFYFSLFSVFVYGW